MSLIYESRACLATITATVFLLGCSTKTPTPQPKPAEEPLLLNLSTSISIRTKPVKQSNARNLEDYKKEIASTILAANANLTFTGPVPPMLSSVTIVKLVTDAQGRTQYSILRSAGLPEFDKVVFQSISKALPLPAPHPELLQGKQAIEHTETWLMRQDSRFQIRSTSSPQIYGSK